MLALYSAAIAIVTGVTSAWVSYRFGVRKDRLQWNRDQAARWDSARREAYVAYAAAIKQEVRLHHHFYTCARPDLGITSALPGPHPLASLVARSQA
ncbi:hypothetical protein [Nocardia sp. NPDC051463]|uniref:hypothetical protein n=1 Tax=Nocardia sp. NPDC051463 TaxID=3154845 RepID=UPI00344F8227